MQLSIPSKEGSGAASAAVPARSLRPPQPRIDVLTGIRFFAAIHVVFYHYAGAVLQPIPALHEAAALGYYAVSIFYVLSGFVLVYSYSDAAGVCRGNRKAFWIGRFARIYPAYVLGFLLCIPDVILLIQRNHQVASGIAKSSIAGLSYLLMVQAWLPQLSAWWNYPGWSVSVEAFFYLCFPFLLTRVSRFGIRQCYLLIGVSWLVSISIYLGVGLIPNLDNTPLWRNAVGYDPLLRLPTFLMGMAIGRMFLLRKGVGPAGSGQSVFAAMLCFGAMGLTLLLPRHTLRDIVITPAFAYLIYSFAQDGGFVRKVFSSRPLILLGDASYSVYILQWPVFFLCGLTFESMTVWKLIIFLFILVTVSVLSFKYLEEPMRRTMKSRLS